MFLIAVPTFALSVDLDRGSLDAKTPWVFETLRDGLLSATGCNAEVHDIQHLVQVGETFHTRKSRRKRTGTSDSCRDRCGRFDHGCSEHTLDKLERSLASLKCGFLALTKNLSIIHCLELRRRSASCQIKLRARPPLPYLHPPNPSSRRTTQDLLQNGELYGKEITDFPGALSDSPPRSVSSNNATVSRLQPGWKQRGSSPPVRFQATIVQVVLRPKFRKICKSLGPFTVGGWKMQRDN